MAALARRGEPVAALSVADGLLTGAAIQTVSVDALLPRALIVARSARLRANDAIYGALALERDAVLITLDNELRQRLVTAFPAARVSS